MQQVDRSYSYVQNLFFFRQAKAESSALIGVHGGPVLQIFHPQSETRRLQPRHSWSIDVVLNSARAELGLDIFLGSTQSYAPTQY
jgi:hypothetical protein